jgi:hypothetical protein
LNTPSCEGGNKKEIRGGDCLENAPPRIGGFVAGQSCREFTMKGNTKGSSARGGAKAAALGLCVLALVFGFALAGCENPGGGGGGDDDGDTTYALGDTGPGGGKIFYVSETGFTMTDTNTIAHYLEAAPADISGKAWASSGREATDISGTATDLGTGRKNTAIILATDVNAPAAKACKDLTTGGKTDWFLPSKDELNHLYTNRSYVGNLNTSSRYWSSTQSGSLDAWATYSDGSQISVAKHFSCIVRPVRAF